LERNATECRWVVVDVETSGLDIRNDSLIAIGAVAVRGDAIDHSDSFEVVLRQDSISSDANILIHGIAAGEQRLGRAPPEALIDFLEFIDGDPLIAFHAFFDQAVLGRACREVLGVHLERSWLDLAHLAPALLGTAPLKDPRSQGLDDWLAAFGLQVSERHRAVADAYATAQLWLALGPALQAAGVEQARSVLKLATDFDWARQNGLRS
jgi:DNA polymerase III subunit epsilon